jgi:large subunit ribosomal protein L22
VSTVETPREIRAQAKYVRMSPRKARLVAEHIRGRSVPEARAVLAFTSREAAGVLQKVLQSAVSNAEANHGIAEDRLYVKATYVDGGPVMKRWRARARGRVARIRKRTCHITITLAAADGVTAVAKPKRSDAPKTDSPKPRSERRGRQRGSDQVTGSQPRPSAENRPQPPRRTQKKGS